MASATNRNGYRKQIVIEFRQRLANGVDDSRETAGTVECQIESPAGRAAARTADIPETSDPREHVLFERGE